MQNYWNNKKGRVARVLCYDTRGTILIRIIRYDNYYTLQKLNLVNH
jgi:hypothetical protein